MLIFANSIPLMAQAQKWALRSKIVIPTFKIYFGSDMHLLQYCAIVIREKISFLHFFSFGISFFFRPYLRCLTLSLVHIYISKSHKLSHSLPVQSDILWYSSFGHGGSKQCNIKSSSENKILLLSVHPISNVSSEGPY